MKNAIKISLLALFVLTFNYSCKKKVSETNPDYIGYWVGSDSNAYYEIDIESNNLATYIKEGTATTTVTGIAKLKGDKLKIGLKKFHVDQHPTADAVGNYTMILDGVSYYRW